MTKSFLIFDHQPPYFTLAAINTDYTLVRNNFAMAKISKLVTSLITTKELQSKWTKRWRL